MNEYRCTRGSLYTHDCAGRDNLKARQGYYVNGTDAADALRQMREDFPDDAHDSFTTDDVAGL